MRVLLTGASSFTGLHFAEAFAEAGHEVVAPLLRPLAAYAGVRAERVRRLAEVAEIVEACPFGSDAFLALAPGVDLLAHHAAVVANYRSPDFDVAAAFAANTHRLREVLACGVPALLLSGSLFEVGEGAGSAPAVAISAYGVAKTITAQWTEHLAREAGVRFGKFVIPNPFGPYEEPRFTDYLLRTWRAGGVATVRTPAYVRDNVHVRLLALAYRRYASELFRGVASPKRNPSGYVETQAAFTLRVADAIRARLGWACEAAWTRQMEFPEPAVRINTEPAHAVCPEFQEAAAWDAFARWAERV